MNKVLGDNMSYSKGRSFEYKVRDLLSNAGFDVTRSAGSRGIKDLVAVKNGRIYYIQCKYNKKDIDTTVKYYHEKINDVCRKYKVYFVFAFRPQPRKHKVNFLVFNTDIDKDEKMLILEDFSDLSIEFM